MRKLSVYRFLESCFGRRLLWRVGRYLYMGARRELVNEPHVNGEHALIAWVFAAVPDAEPVAMVDVGANLGLWSGEALRIAEASGRLSRFSLDCFEPAPAQRQILMSNLESWSGKSTLHFDARAVAARKGKLAFQITGTESGNSGLVAASDRQEKAGVVQVEVASLDEIYAAPGNAHFNLVKVDTEGNDFNVIVGALQLLRQERIDVLQFEYNWRWVAFGHHLKSVFDFADSLPYRVGTLTQQGIELHAAWHPELDRFFETNLVLVRKSIIGKLPCRDVAFAEDSSLHISGGRTPGA